MCNIWLGLPDGSVVKNPPANSGDAGSIPGLGRSPGKEMTTHSSILAWETHRQRSMVGYCPWGHKRIRHTELLNHIPPMLDLELHTFSSFKKVDLLLFLNLVPEQGAIVMIYPFCCSHGSLCTEAVLACGTSDFLKTNGKVKFCRLHMNGICHSLAYVCAKSVQSCWLCETLWIVAFLAILSMRFLRQEYPIGLPCPPPGDLPYTGIKSILLSSPVLAGRFFFTTNATWE